MPERLFISHASEDAAVAERIVAYLEARGASCWISSRDIPPRAIYADAIAEGMEGCSACVVILSAASNQSKAVKRELELASHYDKPFVPIRIDATEPARGFDYYLRNTQWVDYRREGESALDRIVGRASLPPPAPLRSPPVSATTFDRDSEREAAPKRTGRRWLAPSIIAGTFVIVASAFIILKMQSNAREADPATPPATATCVHTSTSVCPDFAFDTTVSATVAATTDPAASETTRERTARAARLLQTQWIRVLLQNPVEPGGSMAGIQLGTSGTDVRQRIHTVLGQPEREDDQSLDFDANGIHLSFWMNGDQAPLRLTNVSMQDDDFRASEIGPFARGVGIGSTKSQVRNAFGAPVSTNLSEGFECYYYPGITFQFAPNGKVNLVAISLPNYEQGGRCFAG